MPHGFETAPSGRARCRGCGRAIGKGELRFGERLPNPFGDGEMTLWFHPLCGAYKRPEPFLEALEGTDTPPENADSLRGLAREGIAHRRLPRLNGAERSPSGRARCRCCRETIDKGLWRISLVFYEDGRFSPAGFVHLTCVEVYFETREIAERIRHFSPLEEADFQELTAELGS